MKVRILGFFCSLLFFATAKGQTIDGRLYTQFNSYYKWRGGGFDSTLLLPIVTAGSGKRAGAVRYNAADSSIYVWTGFQWRKAGNGGVSTPTLAQVTAAGNSTADSLNIVDDNGNRVATLTKVPAGGSNRAGKLLLSTSGLPNQTELNPTTLYFRNGSIYTSLAQKNNPSTQNNFIALPDSSGTLTQRVKLNGTTYNTGSNGVIDLGTISLTPDSTIFATRFWVNSNFQPIGDYLTTGSNGSLQSLTITGTNGDGHIHLRHQSTLPTATGQSTVIYANADGNFAYKNDNLNRTTFVTNHFTTDRDIRFQNKSYTVADSAEVVTKLNLSDTAAMLNGRISSIALNSSGVIHTSPITFSRVGGAWSGQMTLATQSANHVFAGPTTGSAATPTFRALIDADIPSTSKGVQWTGVDSILAFNWATKGFHEQDEPIFRTSSGNNPSSFFGSSYGGLGGWSGNAEDDVNYIIGTTGTSATGTAQTYHGAGGSISALYIPTSSSWFVYSTRIRIPTLNDGTQKFYVNIGVNTTVPAATPPEGVGFIYDLDGTTSGSSASASWQTYSINGANRTYNQNYTGVSVASNTWVKLRIVFNSTVAYYYIDDVLVATHTTNLPSGDIIAPCSGIIKTAGIVARTYHIDYFTIDIKYTR